LLYQKKNYLENIFNCLNNIDIFLLFKNQIFNSNFEVFKYRPCFEPLFFAFNNEVFSVFLKNNNLLGNMNLPNQSEMYNKFEEGTNLMYILHKFFENLFKQYDINVLESNYNTNYYVIFIKLFLY